MPRREISIDYDDSTSTSNRLRKWCIIIASVLTIIAVFLLLIGVATPEWLVLVDQPQPIGGQIQSQFGITSFNTRSDYEHTVGVWQECLTTRLLERVCETRMTFDTNNQTHLWRLAVFFLIISALVCAAEAVQLSICACYLPCVVIVTGVFTCLAAICTTISIALFNSNSLIGQGGSTAGSIKDRYSYGYSYNCVLASCIIFYVSVILYIICIVFVTVQHCSYRLRRDQLREYELRHGSINAYAT